VNAQQLVQNLVWILSPNQFAWPTWNEEPVFSRVLVDPAPPDFFHVDQQPPFALVRVSSSRDQVEHPADLIEEQRFELAIFTSNPSEVPGGAAIVGGNRDNLGSSRNRGILEIEPLVKSQIWNAIGLTARPRTAVGQQTGAAGKMGGADAVRVLEIVATMIPSLPDFAPVQRLKEVSGGGGTVTASWSAPPNRYDLVGYTWVRTSGAVPATSPVGGTFVPGTAAAFAAGVTFTDSPGSGQWSYAFFWAYDVTTDPQTGTNGSPPGTPAPNAWSSRQTAQAGLVYLPATLTVTI